MDFQNDPELEKLFKDELDERASSLVEGAQAMAAGELNAELSGRMLREGHTIKGTGRVMGYEGIAQGGETCELVWRWIQQGDLQPSSMLARTLEHLATAIPEALGGTDHEVLVAIDTIRAMVADPALVAELPDPLSGVAQSTEAPQEEARGGESPEPVTTNEVDIREVTDEPAEAAAEVVAADESVLDAEDIADVAATLDEIEREVERERDGEPAGAATDDAPAKAPDQEQVAVESSQDAEEAPEVASTPVADDADSEESAEAEQHDEAAPVVADAPVASDSDEPLVFEPGPDGKLPTPVITYEIVSSAFADTPASSAATPGALDEPANLEVVADGPSVLDPVGQKTYDLGGLLGAVETWATEESVPVNAGRLFRLINDVAALRIDLDSAVAQSTHLLQGADQGVSAVALEGSLESLETVRRASANLQGAALGLTAIPLNAVTSTLPQLVKYLSKKVDRNVDLILEGEDTIVDRQLVDQIGEVIRQLVVNAVAHGIESTDDRVAAGKPDQGTVKVVLSRDEQHVQIVVTDDGSGIDWKAVRALASEKDLVGDDPTTEELRAVLYAEGFSTNPGSSEFTGEGDGLARVTGIVEDVFGTLTLDSAPGRGTTFVVTLPAYRALQRAQIFTAGGRTWGLPESAAIAVLNIPDVKISVTERGSFIGYKDETIPYSSFATVVGLDVDGLPSQVLILQSPTGNIALAVDDVLDLTEVATKDLSPLLAGSDSVVSGVALLGGNETVMLVDAGRLAEKMRDTEVRSDGPVRTVLIVDDSQGVRQVVSGVLASHGFSTLVAGSVSDALAVLARYDVDALVVDFSMPRADGVALIHMVRQRYGDVPVVMLSGVASEDDRARAERAGVHAFFDKADFAKGALVEKLHELIDTDDDGSAEIAS
ncbi:MAG: response regulator [Acidimicrobiia bacterium]